MAPQAAVNGSNAVVIYRSMASSNLDAPLSNDVMDELRYSRYSGGTWSEPAPLYRETNGTISALEAVMDGGWKHRNHLHRKTGRYIFRGGSKRYLLHGAQRG